MLALQQADMGSKGTGEDDGSDHFARVRLLLDEIIAENSCFSLKDLAIKGQDLMALGYSGREIGVCLDDLLQQVMDEQIANRREELLEAAKK